MIGKLQRKINRAQKGKVSIKVKFDLIIHKVVHIPSTVDSCRVVWQRGAKIQLTDDKPVRDGKLVRDTLLTNLRWARYSEHISPIYSSKYK